MIFVAKFYAVKKGRETGIFQTWDECKKQVDGFSGALYRSFATYQDAKEYLTEKKITNTGRGLIAYVDGSYDAKRKVYGYGCVFLDHQTVVKEVYGKGSHEDFLSMRNVAGEIFGSIVAATYALEHHYDNLYLYYDYEGIEKWATGAWKANKIGTKYYQQQMQDFQKDISITFIKVLAHSGDRYNERADQLAKKAVKS